MASRLNSPGEIIGLPAGGGAIQAIGESFVPDLFTGTGNVSIPIAVPQGRGGAQPALALHYSTGSGNGPLGMGWSLGGSGVSRRTSRGVPLYDDLEDGFLLAGAEQLVPVEPGNPIRYRPRADTAFSRIAHLREAPEADHWRVQSRNGQADLYGWRPGEEPGAAVIADPAQPARIFAWLLAQSEDTFGNRVEYDYLSDPSHGDRGCGQRLLEVVRYVDYAVGDEVRFLVSVRLRYEDRPDPFSDRRAGFEVRTTQRCRELEVLTTDSDGVERVYRRYRFGYAEAPYTGHSLLAWVEVEGEDAEASEAMPPLELEYTAFEPARRRFASLSSGNEPLPALADPDCQLADLDGDGLPDLLVLDGSFRWWRNRGEGRLDIPRSGRDAPAGVRLSDPGVQLLDVEGDGRPELLITREQQCGYFPTDPGGGWSARSFQPLAVAPTFDLNSPEVRLVDLDGDGVTDAIRSGAAIECYYNHPERGWDTEVVVERRNLESFPDVDFADTRLQIADMTGDGLRDIVLVRGRSVEYWPSLGRSRWGRPVTMAAGPRLPDGYDPARVVLGDLDGDGVADLAYVDEGRVLVWLNRAGEGWSETVELPGTPRPSGADSIRLADMLGSGVGGLLWSGAPDSAGQGNLHFLDLTGGHKPYLLSQMRSAAGAETEIEYASSTRYYLEDEQEPETRWRTSLPFPVQVVSRVTHRDVVTGSAETNEYSYHHGYWDGVEREFRGFGRVDQRDRPGEDEAEGSLLLRTWFHLGPVGDALSWECLDFREEYWQGDAPYLPWPALPVGLDRRQERDALRCLRGTVLRSEAYGLDGTPLSTRPYTVSENSFGVRIEVAPGREPLERPGSYFSHPCGRRVSEWERGAEPLTTAQFWDDYDAYGEPRLESTIAVPRARANDYRTAARPGEAFPAVCTAIDFTAAQDDPYIAGCRARVSTYRVGNDGSAPLLELHARIVTEPGGELLTRRLSFYDGPAFEGCPYGELGGHGSLARSETLAFTRQALEGAYAEGAGPRLPPYLDPGGPPPWTDEYPEQFRSSLPPLAGYVYREEEPGSPFGEGYWIRETSCAYDFQSPGGPARGLLEAQRDAVGAETSIAYDRYSLRPVAVTDAAGLTTSAELDPRLLVPSAYTDVNGNRLELTFTPLGMVSTRSVRGREGEAVGDPAGECSTRWVYGLDGAPLSVRTIQRVEYGAPETIESIAYLDGFARPLQTRSQTGSLRFGEPRFGAEVLPEDQADPVGSIVGERTGAPGAPPVAVNGWQRYDGKGNVVERHLPYFATGWEYDPDPAGPSMRLRYDARGRPVSTINPDGSERLLVRGIPARLEEPDVYAPSVWESCLYDENDNGGRTDPQGSAPYSSHWNTPSSRTVDSLGREVETIVRNGRAVADRVVTRRSYDISGNLLQITDPLGRAAFSATYDLLGRVLRSTHLDAGTARSVPDALGRPVERRDARGALRLESYDELDRPRRTWGRDGSAGATTLRTTTTYGDDPESGLTPAEARQRNLLERPYLIEDEAGRLTCEAYDFKGNLLSKRRDLDAPAAGGLAGPFVTTTAYDALDHMQEIELPAGEDGHRPRLQIGYDEGGAVSSLRLDGAVLVERMAYDAFGQRVLLLRGDGTVTRNAYDVATGRLVRLRSETSAADGAYAPAGEVLQDASYEYDLSGNPLAIHLRAPGDGLPDHPDCLDRTMSYDPLYRLLSASGRETGTEAEPPWLNDLRGESVQAARGYEESYSYDACGNLLELRHAAPGGSFSRCFELVAGGNRLAALDTGGARYEYGCDAAGNVVSEATREFAWDFEGRLASWRGEAGSTGLCRYDAHGHRVLQCVDYDGNRRECTVYVDECFERTRIESGGQAVEFDRIRVLAGGALAEVDLGDAAPGPPPLRHVFADLLGSANLLTGAGGWRSREEYAPWGETSFGGFDRKRFRFTGHERDESALYRMGARFYAPYLGRWLAPDPAGPGDAPSLYVYAGDDPMRLVDRSGANSEEAQQPNASRPSASESSVRSQATWGWGLSQTVRACFNPVGDLLPKTDPRIAALHGGVAPQGWLTRTFHAWSEAGISKDFIRAQPGFMMERTLLHKTAEVDFAQASNFGKMRLAPHVFQAIWDQPSRAVARGAALSGIPTQAWGQPGPESVQARVEWPTIKRYGSVTAGIYGFGGLFSLASAGRTASSEDQGLFAAGGAMQLLGAKYWALGVHTVPFHLEVAKTPQELKPYRQFPRLMQMLGGRFFAAGSLVSAVPGLREAPAELERGSVAGALLSVADFASVPMSLSTVPRVVRGGALLGAASLAWQAFLAMGTAGRHGK